MGKHYGQWECGADITAGGQGIISHARHLDGSVGVLKRLKNKTRLDRFKREIETVQALGLQGVAPILDCDVACENPFYVMPYYKNGDLRTAQVFEWALEERFGLFSKVVNTMAAVHERNVVHRDLKPDNILIDDERNPHIADFGLCWTEDGRLATASDEAIGPRFYMAPEMEQGSDRTNATADVYSLGKILYWLLTGKDLPREYLRQGQHSLSHLLKDERAEYFTILLERAMAEDPMARYADGGEFAQEYERAVTSYRRCIRFVGKDIQQRCIFCGLGCYKAPDGTDTPESTPGNLAFFGGIKPSSMGITGQTYNPFRVMVCDWCGNIQYFRLSGAPQDRWRQNRP